MSDDNTVVSDAEKALEIYRKSGSLEPIKTAKITRFDVWQCVFEEEVDKSAYKLLQIMEIKSLFSKYEASDYDLFFGMLAITHLINIRGEQDKPFALTPKEALDVIIDCLGVSCLPCLIESAKWNDIVYAQ